MPSRKQRLNFKRIRLLPVTNNKHYPCDVNRKQTIREGWAALCFTAWKHDLLLGNKREFALIQAYAMDEAELN